MSPQPRVISSSRVRRNLLALAAFAALLVALVTTPVVTPSASAAVNSIGVGKSNQTFTYGGAFHSFRAYRPSGLSGPVPLVVVLHPAFGSGSQAESDYGWDARADAGRFIVIYPEGRFSSWNTGGNCCGLAQANNVDDVGFVTKAVDLTTAALAGGPVTVDPRRVFVTGLSNGAMLAYSLACNVPGKFAAIAPVAGNQTVPCDGAAPASVLHIHGLADTNVPYSGDPGTGAARFDGPPVAEVIDGWRTRNRCEAPTTSRTGVVARSSSTCMDGRAVAIVTIDDGGHGWPGGANRPLSNLLLGLDAPSTAVDATREIWEFFAAHPAP